MADLPKEPFWLSQWWRTRGENLGALHREPENCELRIAGRYEVTPGLLYRGAAPEWNHFFLPRSVYRELERTGRTVAGKPLVTVRTMTMGLVIDLRETGEPFAIELLGSIHPSNALWYRLHVPMSDTERPDVRQLAFVAALVSFLSEHKGLVVYLHCAGGRHRTGLLWAMMRCMGRAVYDRHPSGRLEPYVPAIRWTKRDAFTEMLHYGFYSFRHKPIKEWFERVNLAGFEALYMDAARRLVQSVAYAKRGVSVPSIAQIGRDFLRG